MACHVWLVLLHVVRFESSLEECLNSTSKKEIRTKEDTHIDKYQCLHKSQRHISIFLARVSLTIKKLNYAVCIAENELLGRMPGNDVYWNTWNAQQMYCCIKISQNLSNYRH